MHLFLLSVLTRLQIIMKPTKVSERGQNISCWSAFVFAHILQPFSEVVVVKKKCLQRPIIYNVCNVDVDIFNSSFSLCLCLPLLSHSASQCLRLHQQSLNISSLYNQWSGTLSIKYNTGNIVHTVYALICGFVFLYGYKTLKEQFK